MNTKFNQMFTKTLNTLNETKTTHQPLTEQHHSDNDFFNGLNDYIESQFNVDLTKEDSKELHTIELEDLIVATEHYATQHELNDATEKDIEYLLGSKSVADYITRLLSCAM